VVPRHRVAASMGIAHNAKSYKPTISKFSRESKKVCQQMRQTRPTAVNYSGP
jgi:methylthioribose-1-phosphate isomerase